MRCQYTLRDLGRLTGSEVVDAAWDSAVKPLGMLGWFGALKPGCREGLVVGSKLVEEPGGGDRLP